jgi:hypothetical protein
MMIGPEKSTPSKNTENFWITAYQKKGNFPEITENTGKWLVFVSLSEVDRWWKKIKFATEQGRLGYASKVSTVKPSPFCADPSKKVICIYTYDYNDKKDVMRVREQLRRIGIVDKIPYKTDNATIAGKYSVKGNKHISIYYK